MSIPIPISFLIFIFVRITNQIQFTGEVNSVNGTALQNRQHFYPSSAHFQFQYRPDFGGPWQNAQWSQQRPIFPNNPQQRPHKPKRPSSQANKPIVGVGSATPVSQLLFPGPVNNNVHSKNNFSSGNGSVIGNNGGESMTPVQNENSRDKNSNPGFKSTKTCKCGIIPQSPKSLVRITGGSLSKDNAWPWMAAVVYIGGDSPFWFCGASLVSDRYLLTAAHCQRTIRRKGISNIRILMGTNGIPAKADMSQLFEIADLKSHPLYRPNIEEYDIGLIKLKNKVTFSEKISPICLTQRGSPFTDKLATVAGWGSINYGDSPPENLREVELKVVTNALCQREYLYNYGTRITSAMLCAWLPGKDSCQGDSGGPLFLKDTGSQAYTQIGVVSFGPPNCGETRIPGVYTRLASTIRWIQSNTRDTMYCDGSF